MKQHITPEQLDELSAGNKVELFKGLFPKIYTERKTDGTGWRMYDINHEYLTIGHMIEFLEIDNPFTFWMEWWGLELDSEENTYKDKKSKYNKMELCDALWSEVKELLNEKT